MFNDKRASLAVSDNQHRTPSGVRHPYRSWIYKHDTPNGVQLSPFSLRLSVLCASAFEPASLSSTESVTHPS